MFKMSSSREVVPRPDTGDVVKQGYLKKLKTMRKKYFVLRGDTADASARLEYYESEKKWKMTTCNPKRSIILKSCLNINKKTDARQKWVIALHTRSDEFSIVFDNEEEMEEWLQVLLELQLGSSEKGGPLRPLYEHVWEVWVHSKQLGSKTNVTGPCRLCLTDQSVTLIRREKGDSVSELPLEYSLQKIRRCGHMDAFFYLEVGQYTATGAGNLWLQAEDSIIAKNIHQTIMKYLQSCGKNKDIKELQPRPRDRSVSMNESSRPATGSHTGSTTRERADSMPSRARTSSESASHRPHSVRHPANLHGRPPSTYARGISYSPPVASSPVSPGSAAYSTDSAGSSLSMDGDVTDGHWDDRYSHPLTPDERVITEETPDDYAPWIGEDEQLNNYVRNDTSIIYAQHPNPNSHNSTNNHQITNHDYTQKYSSIQVSRLDMNSPTTGQDSSYMKMSPGEKLPPRAINHSRGSSITEEGYVPMAPGSNDDGYVDMDHGSSVRHTDLFRSGELSTGSSCSITSGTPSTDQKLSDYPLDKVISYFQPEEEIVPAERTCRAYSLGSRPTINKNRTDTQVQSLTERTRAFSVGSKNVKCFNPLRLYNHHPHVTSSHSSDMMELDFSKKGRMKNRKKPSSSERLSVPGGSVSTLSSESSYSPADGSYMDMSPRCSPPKNNRLLAMLGKSPPKHDLYPCTRNSPPVSGYPSPSLGRVPEIEPFGTESSYNSYDNNSYVEMKPKNMEGNQKIIAARNAKARIESFPNISRLQNSREDHLEPSLKRKLSRTCTIPEDNNNSKVVVSHSPTANYPDEYVEMNLGPKTVEKSPTDDDYMEMDGRSGGKTEMGRSQPIAIQTAVREPPHNANFSIGGRKNSVGSSPKQLSFFPSGSSPSPVSSPYGTLGRNRSRKTLPRRDSRDMSASSNSSSSIFPLILNSFSDEYEQKCPVDATSGTVVISNESSKSVDDLTKKVNSNCVIDESPNSEDYVMYQPHSSRDDYARMAPVNPNPPIRKTSVPLLKFKFNLLLSGLGVSTGPLTSSASTPSIKMACSSGNVLSEPVESPTLQEEEEEEEVSPTKTQDKPLPSETPPEPKATKELHYASLDLPRSGSESEESNQTLKTQTSITESSSASSPSPNTTDGATFNYAEIDFARSGSSNSVN